MCFFLRPEAKKDVVAAGFLPFFPMVDTRAGNKRNIKTLSVIFVIINLNIGLENTPRIESKISLENRTHLQNLVKLATLAHENRSGIDSRIG